MHSIALVSKRDRASATGSSDVANVSGELGNEIQVAHLMF